MEVVRRCEHLIHECMRGKPLDTWHIYIYEDDEYEGGPIKGDLILAKFDKNFVSHPIVAVGVDGLLHLFKNISRTLDGVKLDSEGRIVVDS